MHLIIECAPLVMSVLCGTVGTVMVGDTHFAISGPLGLSTAGDSGVWACLVRHCSAYVGYWTLVYEPAQYARSFCHVFSLLSCPLL